MIVSVLWSGKCKFTISNPVIKRHRYPVVPVPRSEHEIVEPEANIGGILYKGKNQGIIAPFEPETVFKPRELPKGSLVRLHRNTSWGCLQRTASTTFEFTANRSIKYALVHRDVIKRGNRG